MLVLMILSLLEEMVADDWATLQRLYPE